jgi:spermidine synthase
MSHLAGHPLRDPRCEAVAADVFDVIRDSPATFDVIVLDVDNGPIALSATGNQRLYSARGVRQCLAALRPGGVLGVWSAAPSDAFEQRLRGIGQHTEVVTTPAHPSSRSKHTLFFTHAPLTSSARAAEQTATSAGQAKPTASSKPAPRERPKKKPR